MKFVSAVNRRLPWLNVAAGVLVVLLQRSPAVRVFLQAKDYVIASRAGELLRAAFTAAALGAMQSRAGATTFQPSSPNPVRGRVGEPLQFAFTYTGTPSSPASFRVSGTLPPGLIYSPTPIAGTIPSGSPVISGTPTQAGTFTIEVQGFNAEGLTNNVQQSIVFQIEGGATSAPTITTQPQSQTVTAGANVTLSVVASGTPAPTYQWTRNGVNISGATSASLALSNVAVSDTGVYAVNVTNSAGTVPSSAATLTVSAAGGTAPTITSQPIGFTAAAGSTAAFTVVATGTGNTYQWRRGGAALAGATNATLLVPNVAAASAGDYSVVVSNGGASTTSSAATLRIEAGASRLANLSVRTNLASGARLIVGFATNGPKDVLLRGIGPTLGEFGVDGAYADPRLELYNSTGAMVGQNNDWGGAATLASAFSSVGAFALGGSSRDAAMQTSISSASTSTAHATGAGSGVVLVEVYDAGAGSNVRLTNVSARNAVGTGDNILIAGFVVEGSVGKTLLIRAVGPTLGSFGVEGTLVDPALKIFDNSSGTVVVENDNWAASLANTFTSVGAFGLTAGSRDAALVVTLMPGAYSAQVSGVANGTGEALVEVYEVP